MPSFLTAILGLALVASTQAHVSIINIYGSNNQVGHAFGVDTKGRYPRVLGAPGDAGGDSGLFQTGTDNPSPACGSTPELGPLDVPAWLDQAEGFGLPAAYANMSVVMEVFQVNRDGGGPMSCEYNDDATATSWRPMFMSLNQAGNSGIENQQRVNSTVVANFPKDASCTGGFTQTACIVRCRTGVNRRFGGCFAVKLSNSEPYAATVSTDLSLNASSVARVTTSAPSDSDAVLSDQDLDRIAQTIMSAMQSNGFLISAAAVGSLHNTSLSVANASSGAISRLVDTSQTVSNIPTGLPSLNIPSGIFGNNLTDASDASDAADAAAAASTAAEAAVAATTPGSANASDAAAAMRAVNATDASDVADAVFYHVSNQTNIGSPVADTSASTSLSTAAPTNNPDQPATTSKVVVNRSKRHSCSSHKRRHKSIRGN